MYSTYKQYVAPVWPRCAGRSLVDQGRPVVVPSSPHGARNSGRAGLLSPPHRPPRRAERPASQPPAVSHCNRHGRHGAPAAVTGAAAAARRGGYAGPRGGSGGSDCRLPAGSPCGVCSEGGPLLYLFSSTSPLYFHRPFAAPSTPAVAAPPNVGRWPPAAAALPRARRRGAGALHSAPPTPLLPPLPPDRRCGHPANACRAAIPR